MFSLPLLLLLLVLCIGWCQRKAWRLIWQLNGWRGLMHQPLIWCLLFLHLEPKSCILNALQRHRQLFKRPLAILIGNRVWLYADDPVTIERLLNTQECLDKSFLQDGFYLRKGLLHAKGDQWKPRRKQLNPVFGRNVLLSFFDAFNKVGNVLVEQFETNMQGDVVPYGKLEALISRAVLEISCHTTMGTQMQLTKEDTQDITNTYRRLVELSALRIVKPWLQNDLLFRLLDRKNYKDSIRINKLVEEFVCHMVQRKYVEWKEANAQPQAEEQSSTTAHPPAATGGATHASATQKRIFIEQIFHLADTGALTPQDIMNESSSMLMVSFETISSCLIIALLCLAMHPRCQRKLRREINETLEANNATVCHITPAQLQQMKYLEMVLNETLRLLPTVPLNIRQASRDFVLRLPLHDKLTRAQVPAGSVIVIDTFSMQRDAAHWGPHALRFDPERHFNDEMGEVRPEADHTRHSYAFIPFSKGLRYCIGNRYTMLLTKMLLAKLIYHFEYGTTTKLQDLRFIEGISLKLHNTENITMQIRRVSDEEGKQGQRKAK